MFPAVLLSLSLLSAAPRTLASPGLSAINIDERVATFYGEFFAQELAVKSGFRVVTQAELATLLGLERQRQLLGCSDDSTSCMAELAGALGAEGVITGSIARLGSGFAVTLKVISPGDARTLAVRTGRSKDEDALLDWLTETAGVLAGQLQAAFAPAGVQVAVQVAAPVATVDLEVPPASGNPRRIARDGKLFTELETARYFVARQRGLSEADAIRAARGLPPVIRAAGSAEVSAAPVVDAGPPVPFVPAPLPRRVARGGKVLTDAQTKRYFEARSSGQTEADAFAFALTTPVAKGAAPPPMAPALVVVPATDAGSSGGLPSGLPKRIARDGKLLSAEETERYFREKFKLAP